MNIIFTPDTFLLQSYGGISRYFVRMAEAMMQQGHKIRIPARYHFNHYLNTSAIGHGTVRVQRESMLNRRFMRLINGVPLQFDALVRSPDILHFTFFRRFPPVLSKAKKVLTVFDMIDELFHQQNGEESVISKVKRRAVHEADLVLCISENTRQDLIRLFDISPAKAIVTYLAADEPPVMREGNHHPLNGASFLLYVGHRNGYKNFRSSVESFARLQLNKRDLKFVAFGSGSFDQNEIALFRSLGLDESSVIHAKGSDTDLYNYYRHAVAFIYPSLYEGFGIPPLEAMSVGCPVICSNVSSIPEIVGDAAFLFDPREGDAIDIALEAAISDTTARTEKIELGYKQFQKFSWEKCAADTLSAYEHVLGVRS